MKKKAEEDEAVVAAAVAVKKKTEEDEAAVAAAAAAATQKADEDDVAVKKKTEEDEAAVVAAAVVAEGKDDEADDAIVLMEVGHSYIATLYIDCLLFDYLLCFTLNQEWTVSKDRKFFIEIRELIRDKETKVLFDEFQCLDGTCYDDNDLSYVSSCRTLSLFSGMLAGHVHEESKDVMPFSKGKLLIHREVRLNTVQFHKYALGSQFIFTLEEDEKANAWLVGLTGHEKSKVMLHFWIGSHNKIMRGSFLDFWKRLTSTPTNIHPVCNAEGANNAPVGLTGDKLMTYFSIKPSTLMSSSDFFKRNINLRTLKIQKKNLLEEQSRKQEVALEEFKNENKRMKAQMKKDQKEAEQKAMHDMAKYKAEVDATAAKALKERKQAAEALLLHQLAQGIHTPSEDGSTPPVGNMKRDKKKPPKVEESEDDEESTPPLRNKKKRRKSSSKDVHKKKPPKVEESEESSEEDEESTPPLRNKKKRRKSSSKDVHKKKLRKVVESEESSEESTPPVRNKKKRRKSSSKDEESSEEDEESTPPVRDQKRRKSKDFYRRQAAAAAADAFREALVQRQRDELQEERFKSSMLKRMLNYK